MFIHFLVYTVQMIGILIPFAGCVILLKRAKSNASMYLLFANLGCLIINGSYSLLLSAKTYEGANIALKSEYFGNIVFYVTFALFLWTYLRMKHYRWAVVGMSAWAVIDVLFFFFIWIGNGTEFGLAFRKLDFLWDVRTGLVMIRLEPGLLYSLHYCIVSVIGLCGMVYTIVRIFFVQIPSERRNLAKLAVAQGVIIHSLVIMIYFELPFDIVPVCTSLAILTIIVSIHRNEFFGVTELGQQWVFEQMEDAFIIVDEMYGYLDANAYAKKIFPELNHNHKNDMVSGEVCHLFMDADKIQNIQGKNYNKKVMEIWEKGRLTGYSLLLVDVTEQYELLERVKQEKERADAANQAKSAFVSNVSHEIRTPMNAIVGMTQIMLRRDLPEQDKEYLLNIQNSGNALLTIINDLLDMSKIESGKMELVDEEYSFMTMLSDLGMIILNRIGVKPVELLFDIDPDIPAKLYGDALRIRQIIINLMNNATKFTEEGYVCLTVKVKEVRQDDIELFVSIKDTGQGIKEEDMEKLFGSFQQVDTKKNHHKEGTGLGLSISKQLVELMDGSIGVKSEYGKGSEFYFTICQRIVDKEQAAQISENCRAVAAGSMKNASAQKLLKELAGRYQLTFVEDILSMESVEPFDEKTDSISDGQADAKLFYFTDQYETLDKAVKEKLRELDAVVCGLHNPMTETEFPDDLLTMNKPLYSYNFCNLIENGRDMETGKEVSKTERSKEENYSGRKEETEFTAPDAKVLIVDDNEINRMVAEEMLKPLQVQTETASDGKQAVELIQKNRYDLVFMDHLMPVMNGVEAAEAIRRLDGEYYKNLPIIALTGNTAKEQREEYRQAGMSDYLSKPMDMTDVYQVIKKWAPDKINYK